MAANTFTRSDVTAQPRKVHEGLTVARGTVSGHATSTTLSDIYLMCKIPNHVWIIDGYLVGTHPAAASDFKAGISGNDDAFLTAASITSGNLVRFSSTELPLKISLSDSANPQWVWALVTMISGSSTATSSLTLVVKYAATGAVT